MRILLAEDERELGQWLSKALQELGMRVDWVDDGRLVETSLATQNYDALVLDLGLPGLDGHGVLQRLRAQDVRVPVLVLTARDSLAEKVDTLNEGADDFLAKPFAIAELEARLTALARRARGASHPRFACGPLSFDTVSRQFSLQQRPLALPPREYGVLRALVMRSGEPLSKQDLLDRVFGDDDHAVPELVEVVVHRLRKRLENSGVRIVTLRGLGYVLEPV